MQSVIQKIEAKYMKPQVVAVRSGDTVKVHQRIREGNKERVQIFEGLVLRTDRRGSHTSSITVRRIASGVGVEKTYLLHSPLVLKVEVTKRTKVRRNYISYMRGLTGKSARLSGIAFDKGAVNTVHDAKAEAEEEKIHEAAVEQHEAEANEESDTEAKETSKSAEKDAK